MLDRAGREMEGRPSEMSTRVRWEVGGLLARVRPSAAGTDVDCDAEAEDMLLVLAQWCFWAWRLALRFVA